MGLTTPLRPSPTDHAAGVGLPTLLWDAIDPSSPAMSPYTNLQP